MPILFFRKILIFVFFFFFLLLKQALSICGTTSSLSWGWLFIKLVKKRKECATSTQRENTFKNVKYRCCRNKTLYLHFLSFFSFWHKMKMPIAFYIVSFMINGPKETAQNDVKRCLVPLTYIKSFTFSFSCKVTILEIQGFDPTAAIW